MILAILNSDDDVDVQYLENIQAYVQLYFTPTPPPPEEAPPRRGALPIPERYLRKLTSRRRKDVRRWPWRS